MDFHGYPDFDASPVRPLDMPFVRPQAARRNAALAIPREPLVLAEGISVSLMPDGSVDWTGAGKTIDIAFTVAGEAGYITTVLPVVQRILARAETGIHPARLDSELAALAVETVFADRIELLEEALGGEVALLNLDRTEPHGTMASLSVHLRMGDTVHPGTIHASATLLSTLARHWESQPAIRRDLGDVTVTLAYRVAFTDLAASALRMLAVGDAMLFDRVALPGGAAVILAESVHASATFNDEGYLYLSDSFRIPERYGMGDFVMSDETDPDRAVHAVADAAIDDLPVRLVFEVGRKDVTLDQLRSLAVGAPVPLDRAASSAVQIFANGRRIGAGEMVMIGEQLGVRITQLNTNA